MKSRRSAHIALHRAFDESRFGPSRTLDLRSSFPTAAEAVRRAEPWLRERQVAGAGEVLVITGQGKGSPGGVGVVRQAVATLLRTLQRKGVVEAVGEHTTGSFVVTLAPIRALFEAAPRSRSRGIREAPPDPEGLRMLAPATRYALRRLAERSLETLGAPRTDRFVHDEMLREFSVLSGAIDADEPDREGRLAFLIEAARDAYDGVE